MQELDTRAQAVMRDIDAMGDDFMNNVKSMSSEKKKEVKTIEIWEKISCSKFSRIHPISISIAQVMTKIQQQFNKAKELGDDKVQLAIQTYELVSVTSLEVLA